MFKFSIQNAFRRKGIAFLAIVGTALGCALMTTLLSLSDGMDAKMQETVNELAGDIMVTQKNMMIGGVLPLAYEDEIKELDDVEYVIKYVDAYIPKEAMSSPSPMGTQMQGIEPDRPARSSDPLQSITAGRTLQSKGDLIVGRQLLSQLSRTGNELHIGDMIAVPKAHSQETVQLTIVGFFETGVSVYDMMLMGHIDTAREIMGLPDDMVSSYIVRARTTDAVEGLADQIKELFADREMPVDTLIPSEMIGDINEMMDTFHLFLLAISAVAAVAGGMSIAIVMLMSVMERMPEFGVFKATGWENRNIIATVIIESTTVSTIGASIGLGIGAIGDAVINHYLETTIGVIDLALALQVVAFGVVMGVLGGLYPAVRAARVDPIRTLSSL